MLGVTFKNRRNWYERNTRVTISSLFGKDNALQLNVNRLTDWNMLPRKSHRPFSSAFFRSPSIVKVKNVMCFERVKTASSISFVTHVFWCCFFHLSISMLWWVLIYSLGPGTTTTCPKTRCGAQHPTRAPDPVLCCLRCASNVWFKLVSTPSSPRRPGFGNSSALAGALGRFLQVCQKMKRF